FQLSTLSIRERAGTISSSAGTHSGNRSTSPIGRSLSGVPPAVHAAPKIQPSRVAIPPPCPACPAGIGSRPFRSPMIRPLSPMSGPRFQGLRGDVRGDMLAEDRVGVDVLVEARQHDPGRKLAADLVAQRVPELQRGALFHKPCPHLIREA